MAVCSVGTTKYEADIGRLMERRLDRRVFLCNDANAAAYGEAVAGAARGVALQRLQ